MYYSITTLGCKVNQYETQAMENLLQQRGHQCAAPGQIADAVIVNTCAVTAESGRKSRQTIRRLKEENPGAVVAVAGCYSQLSPEAAAQIGADVIFGTHEHERFVEAVEQAVRTREGAREVDDPFRRHAFERLPAGAIGGRTRAMLKIQDGCVNFCTYCIIPYTRGHLRSLPLEEAAAETAEEQSAELTREERISEFLTGRDITWISTLHYMRDHPGVLLTGSPESRIPMMTFYEQSSWRMKLHVHNSFLQTLALLGVPGL